jgi:Xaa-Pro dipeptidase
MDLSARELPFSLAEYRSRLAMVHAEMRRRGLDLLLVFWPENIYYLSGYHTLGYFGFQVLFVPLGSAPCLLVRQTERQNTVDLTYLDDLEFYQDTEDPLGVMVRAMISCDWDRRNIGIEFDAWFLTTRNFLNLKSRLDGFNPSDASQLVNKIRLIKSEQEIGYIRQAARAAEASLHAGLDVIHAGVREYEVAAEMHRALLRAGSEYLGHPPLLGSGPHSARGTATWSDRVIREGDPIMVEPGGCVKRYHAMFIRTMHMKQPKDKTFLRLVELSLEGLLNGLATVRAGVTSAEVDDSLKARARDAGFGHFATSRGGYSVGIGFPPDWSEGRTLAIKQGDPTILQANMTFHLLSNLWYEDKSLVSFSETIRVTDTGCEVLTNFPRELFVRD